MVPTEQLLTVNFSNEFEFVPQQEVARIAGAMPEYRIKGVLKPKISLPALSGVEYSPTSTDAGGKKNLVFRPVPFASFSVSRTRFRRAAFTWNYAIARDDLDRINQEFLMFLPRIARFAYERFKDRCVLTSIHHGKYEGTPNDYREGQLASSIPFASVYVTTNTSAAVLKELDLQAFQDQNDKFSNLEAYSPEMGRGGLPFFVASNAQVNNVAKDTKVTDINAATLAALMRGDTDTFHGFRVIRTNQMPKPNIGIWAANSGDRTARLQATGSYTAVASSVNADDTYEYFFAFHPLKSIMSGRNPVHRYTKAYFNYYNRAGALEFIYKDIHQAAVPDFTNVTLGITKKLLKDTDRKLPATKGTEPYDNADGNTQWDYTNAA